MSFAGYIAAALIGLSLGLIGGGGSILTIPVLVYLFGLQPAVATGYSLFIVGCTSLVGAVKNYKNGRVDISTAIYFGGASVVTVFITRKYLLHLIPEQLFTIGHTSFTKSLVIMILFAALMIITALKMIFDKYTEHPNEDIHSPKLLSIIVIGIGIGLLTGLLGAGGGFLIIPVLIFFFHLPMKKAIGTSLLIIALNSLIGFTGDLMNEKMNWQLLLSISAISIAGVLAGTKLNDKMNGASLRKGFGWFILILGVFIIAKELFFNVY